MNKLYKKLDAYMISQRLECESVIYWGSSNAFKTQKEYKAWLLNQQNWSHLDFKIGKGE